MSIIFQVQTLSLHYAKHIRSNNCDMQRKYEEGERHQTASPTKPQACLLKPQVYYSPVDLLFSKPRGIVLRLGTRIVEESVRWIFAKSAS